MSFKPTSPGNRQTQVTKSPRYFSKPGSTASKRPNNLQINSQEDEEIPTKSHNSATNVKSRDNFTSLFRYGKNSPTAASAKQGFRYSPKGSTQVAKQASSPTVQSRTPSYQTRSKPATPKKASTPKAASSRFEETKYKKSATPKSRDRPSPSNYVFPTTKQNPMTKSSSRLQRREAQTTAGAQQKPAAQRQDHLNQFITKVKGTESSAQQKTQSPEEIKMRSEVIYREHLFQTFQALKFIRQLPQVDQAQLRSKRVNLSRMNEKIGKKTLVFDLDETLVHCCDDITTSNPHVILPIIFPTGEEVNAGINIRPYAKE